MPDTPTPPDAFDSPTSRHWHLAEQAYDAGQDDAAAAHAAIVTVHQTSGILRLLEQLTEAIGDSIAPQWVMFRDYEDGPIPFRCTCGADAFSEYPLRPEVQLTWWVCNNPDCDAIWGDMDTRPSLISGGVEDFNNDPPWNVHDLVRHRSGVGQHNGGNSQVEYVAMLQSRDSDDPGWWNATVLRVVNPPAHTSPPIVGQGVRLREDSMHNRVARFP